MSDFFANVLGAAICALVGWLLFSLLWTLDERRTGVLLDTNRKVLTEQHYSKRCFFTLSLNKCDPERLDAEAEIAFTVDSEGNVKGVPLEYKGEVQRRMGASGASGVVVIDD